MAPNWITISNSFVNGSVWIPIKAEVMAICPVEEMGKNSVMPSIIAMMTAWMVLMRYQALGLFMMAYTSTIRPAMIRIGAMVILRKL